MDFGVGFLSNNVMLPILDFFYGIVPSYGLAIVALTLVVRFALFPVTANQLRGMRRMKIANPIMQQRLREVQTRYKDDPAKLQEEQRKVTEQNFKEFGNPFSGCLPVLLQMPILFALFATLRGSPFADINYTLNFQIYPLEQQAQIQPQAFVTPPQNVYFADRVHYQVQAAVKGGTNLLVGDRAQIELQVPQGESFSSLNAKYPDIDLTPKWHITKGADKAEVSSTGEIKGLQAGDVTVQATIPGLASDKGFLFIQALGRVGATNPDGSLNWDILVMVIGFGLSLYINQAISGNQPNPNADDQQETMNKITPVIFSGMFLFFPLPAGVLMYMLIANVFQTIQSFLVAKEPLPENLQKIVDGLAANPPKAQAAIAPTVSKQSKIPIQNKERNKEQTSDDKPGAKPNVPFEPGSNKKKKS